jgi:hypothetical protein
MLGQKSLFPWRAREENYSFYPVCLSRSGAFRSVRRPGRLGRAPQGDEELAEGIQEDPQATKEVAKKEHEIAKEGDQELEEAALPLIASQSSLSASRRRKSG